MTFRTPSGMSRRHFLSHLAGASAMTIPALTLGHSLRTHAAELKKNHKAAILLWMSGGPSTMDIWDLKPGAPTGGPFKPISTAGDVQISEHMPMTAKVMDRLSIVRSICLAHDGQVKVESTEGQGSVFHIELPLARDKRN